jgi:ABC-2 type transport system permease protein
MTATAPTRASATAQTGGRVLTGSGTLARLVLRRDRIRIPVWVGALTLWLVAVAASFPGLYPTAAERQARAQLMANPTARALSGPGYGLGDYTFGAMLANETLGLVAVLVALMSVLLVVRHTRAEEASGRAELIRSGVVGRQASTTAAIAVVAAINLVLGAAVAVGLISLGIDSIDWPGSLLLGASLAAVGLVFTGVGAVTAQLTVHPRAASGTAGLLIGIAYALRAAGDTGGGTLAWLSPIGWAQATRVYVADRWWPLALAVAASAALVAVAIRLSARRDLGAGLRVPRPGRAAASDALATPIGFALRLQRASLIGWAVALFAFGLVYGTLTGDVQSFIEQSQTLQNAIGRIAGAPLIDAFLALVISLLAIVSATYVILAALRMRDEESAGRAEPLLAAAWSRPRWAASHLVIAMAGGALVLLTATLGLGIGAAGVLHDAAVVPRLLASALAYVPALWFVAGLAVALFGLVPRAAALVWVVVAYGLTVQVLGGLLGLPDWTYDLSPFAHIPAVPAQQVTFTPLVVLTALAAALVTVGLTAFRNRDLQSP